MASAPTVRPVAAAMALAVALGCASEKQSPVAPAPGPATPTAFVSGDAVWFDPTGNTFLLDRNHDALLVDVSSSTRFVGTLRSVLGMSVAYANGYRLPVAVVGVEITGSVPHRFSASSVDAQARETYRYAFGGAGSLGTVRFSDPRFGRFGLEKYTGWSVYVTRSTMLDPSGDFTTFESLIAAMERDEVRYVSGEGWEVSTVGRHARTMKATRQPH